jgi:hypothetical protein
MSIIIPVSRHTLIERAFERDAADYPDVRHLTSPGQIQRRMQQLLIRLSGLPLKKQAARITRRLLNEYQLLKAKLILLAGTSRAEDATLEGEAQLAFNGAMAIIQGTDLSVLNSGQKKEKHEKDRRKQTVVLMHFIYAKYNTEEQLRQALRLKI